MRDMQRKKAALEAYITAILPFGGRHGDAMDNLTTRLVKLTGSTSMSVPSDTLQ